MPSISGSFTGAGVSDILFVSREKTIDYSLTGTFVGTYQLERAKTPDALNWEIAAGPFTAPVAAGVYNIQSPRERLRWRCISHTSGTASYTAEDGDAILFQIIDPVDGTAVFLVKQSGVSFQGTIDGVLTDSDIGTEVLAPDGDGSGLSGIVTLTGIFDDLNTLGAPTTDGEFVVATGAGAFAYESGATARASLGLTIGTNVLAPDGSGAGLSGVLKPGDIGSTVQGYDADTLKADTADVLTAGFAGTPYNAGTQSSGTFTPDEANGNLQYAANGGAHTLAPPTNNTTIIVQYTNNGSAGTVTTSGFTAVTGDTITTTDGHDFLFFITKLNGFSHLNVVALQ